MPCPQGSPYAVITACNGTTDTYGCGCSVPHQDGKEDWRQGDHRWIGVMAPTSAEDPEGAARQRARYPDPDESDWKGMLYGLGFAVGGILVLIGLTHLYLRFILQPCTVAASLLGGC